MLPEVLADRHSKNDWMSIGKLTFNSVKLGRIDALPPSDAELVGKLSDLRGWRGASDSL